MLTESDSRTFEVYCVTIPFQSVDLLRLLKRRDGSGLLDRGCIDTLGIVRHIVNKVRELVEVTEHERGVIIKEVYCHLPEPSRNAE